VPRWATFDCYGTLIDWNTGIRDGLADLWPGEDSERLLAEYHELEPGIQKEEPTLPYREVMAEVTRRIAARHVLKLETDRAYLLAETLPAWSPFPEVPASLAELVTRGWRLAALSNTDPELISTSIDRIGVPFDEVITAADAGSYKPDPGHWRVFFERTGATRDEHVHVAQSYFHDIAPASALGLTSVWINRLGEDATPAPTRELADLASLPQTLDALVPPPDGRP
jgi:2-haloacid dehalogenase